MASVLIVAPFVIVHFFSGYEPRKYTKLESAPLRAMVNLSELSEEQTRLIDRASFSLTKTKEDVASALGKYFDPVKSEYALIAQMVRTENVFALARFINLEEDEARRRMARITVKDEHYLFKSDPYRFWFLSLDGMAIAISAKHNIPEEIALDITRAVHGYVENDIYALCEDYYIDMSDDIRDYEAFP